MYELTQLGENAEEKWNGGSKIIDTSLNKIYSHGVTLSHDLIYV